MSECVGEPASECTYVCCVDNFMRWCGEIRRVINKFSVLWSQQKIRFLVRKSFIIGREMRIKRKDW